MQIEGKTSIGSDGIDLDSVLSERRRRDWFMVFKKAISNIAASFWTPIRKEILFCRKN